MAKELMLAR